MLFNSVFCKKALFPIYLTGTLSICAGITTSVESPINLVIVTASFLIVYSNSSAGVVPVLL